MPVPEHIFREYDIRGLADEELNSENVQAIALAFGTLLKRKGIGRICLGGDVRPSTERIRKDVIEGITLAGIDVTDVGVVTTPMLYWSLYHYGVNGGIMITGSHNPPEFNGLKLAVGKTTLYGRQIKEIYDMISKNDLEKGTKKGSVFSESINEPYINMLLSKITLGPKKLKVVTDSGNGTAGPIINEYLKRSGCEVVPLFAEPDGRFPNHHPDPTKRENLGTLIDTVIKEKADVGLGFDGDADRIGVVDDQGNIVWGDILMILFWREILPKHPGAKAIVEIKSSQALVDEIERLGGEVVWWKSGHSLIKAKMKELNALFSGEVSGHMFFADEYYGFDDSFYAAGRLLRILSNSDKSLSEMLSDVPKYYSTAETRIPCSDEEKFQVIEKIKESALKDYDAITIDGVRILYPRGWGLVRASNTQPVLVARAEGKTEKDLEEYCNDLKKRILEAGVDDFQWEY
ncbi:phosphomannomutase [Thermovirga lienii DSM 17291]|jgi:phosphomannomutase/phosphoglucomutase|uniref:Phosphomannomutase n=1 Tax=Thermovirga lienii (strain ATCC BAA-1197 / DSM 17291 / Cas60314) TaxID=580340 RepID=G7V7P0_THELD|nr:phosphomannomutase/phosphoglucomutase [Thermovirga lienii]AER67294.1 phosphomannomutase [Thermovirga lienii DSM 17291]MDN5318229.1 phosphomannomutase / phosphoglucomutase [Thermovirga sp.]MDN5367518.1 phosphomannomutase / phosphoglucomutase [Thermovirga sp.]